MLQDFILGKEIEGKVVGLFELDKHFNTNDFISMLFYNGYLTIKDTGMRTRFRIPNYISERLYADYMLQLVDIKGQYRADTSKLEEAVQKFGEEANMEYLVKYVQEFLMYCSVRDKENFTERELKHLFQMRTVPICPFFSFKRNPKDSHKPHQP